MSTRNDGTTWTSTGSKPSPQPKLASAYTPVHATPPETLAAALHVLRQCGAEDLAPMLGLVEA